MPGSFVVAVRLAIAFVALASADASAQTSVSGPYYAAPSWDQTLPAASRFLVLSNFNGEAVLDRETGLVWTRSPLPGLPSQDFGAAYLGCFRAKVGNRRGWRLPALPELTSLLDPSVEFAPSLPAGHPFVLPPATLGSGIFFWTGTRIGTGHYSVFDAGRADFVLFSGDSSGGFATNALCVRGPGATGD